ncbi:MAG: GTPase ObgE [Gemmatimonadales bacterium]
MFIDQVTIEIAGGDGGSGRTAFRREKFYPKGGPSGGDGGSGGSVYAVGDSNLWTLLDFTYHRKWLAEKGEPGGTSQRTGKSADDLLMPVPLGTVFRDAGTGEVIGEAVAPGERILLAKGGRGGLGNQHFATPTRQAPHHFQPGEDGVKRTIELTLKLIADVGLLGEPNAGKSTLLASVTAARPKIADYPFTTLEPNLGVVSLSDHRSFVVADIPGIIEGAHAGKGLGIKFLRHVERTRILLHMIPLDAPDLAAAYRLLRKEAAKFSPELAAKPHCVAWTKADLVLPDEVELPEVPDAFASVAISSVARIGLEELLEVLWKRLVEERAVEMGANT